MTTSAVVPASADASLTAASTPASWLELVPHANKPQAQRKRTKRILLNLSNFGILAPMIRQAAAVLFAGLVSTACGGGLKLTAIRATNNKPSNVVVYFKV